MQTLLNQLSPQQQQAFDLFLSKNKDAKFFNFELLDASSEMTVLDERNMAHKQPMYASRNINGETMFDSPEGQQVRLVYSKSNTRVRRNGVEELEAVPESIWFEAARQGLISVPVNQHIFLTRMLFSNECENSINPAKRELPSGPVYRLVQPEKTAKQAAEDRLFRVKVQGLIGENTDQENTLIAQRLQAMPSKRLSFDFTNADNLRVQLLDAVEVDADAVFMATTDSSVKNTALVKQATDAGVIRFLPETREWRYVDNNTVLQVLPTGDPVQGLADWFADAQGSSARRAIQNVLDGKTPKSAEKPKGIRLASGDPVPDGYDPKPGKLGMHWPLKEQE